VVTTPDLLAQREPAESVKKAVIRRDGWCLCCGETRRLQVDHIAPTYLGGGHEMHNLQTLCGVCNRDKAISKVNYRVSRTPLTSAPRFVLLQLPRPNEVGALDAWERYLRRTVNRFYQCAAVDSVDIGSRGPSLRHWKVKLCPGNEDAWIEPHLEMILESIWEARRAAGLTPPEELSVFGVGQVSPSWS